MNPLLRIIDIIFRKDSDAKQEHKPSPSPAPERKTAEPTIAKEYIATPRSIKIDSDAFKPLERQIIYIEGLYNSAANDFIQKNYETICAHFRSHYYEFCYLPKLTNLLLNKRIIEYYAPYDSSVNRFNIDSDFLLRDKSLEERKSIGPSLLYNTERLKFKIMPIDLAQVSEDFSEILTAITKDIKANTSDIRYSIKDNHAMYDYVQAEYDDEETWRVISLIEKCVRGLAQKGISEHIIQQIISKPEVVSRMVITQDYRIFLPDYKNMEITMTPLVKAVYILFLRHPEGIIFKHLPDYRKELEQIYADICQTDLSLTMIRSVADATDPTKNSINEKVARIREAFVTRFDKHLSVNYIIDGERGMPKRIPLHRELVEWQ